MVAQNKAWLAGLAVVIADMENPDKGALRKNHTGVVRLDSRSHAKFKPCINTLEA
jgi:hypothetical protein